MGNVAVGLHSHLRGSLGGDVIITDIHVVPHILGGLILVTPIGDQAHGVEVVDGVEHGVAVSEAGTTGGHAGLGHVGQVLDLSKVDHSFIPEVLILLKAMSVVGLEHRLNQPSVGSGITQADTTVLVLQLILTGQQSAKHGHTDGLNTGAIAGGGHVHQRLHVEGGILGQPVVQHQIDLNIGHGGRHAFHGIVQHGIHHVAVVPNIGHEGLVQHGHHILHGIVGNKKLLIHVAQPLNGIHGGGFAIF